MKYIFDFNRNNPLAYMEVNRILRRIPKDMKRELDRLRKLERRIERLEKQITEEPTMEVIKDENLKETVKREPHDLEVLVRAHEKHKVIVEVLNLEITNLKKQIEQLKEENTAQKMEMYQLKEPGSIDMFRENQKLKDKVAEYKKLYGVERSGGYIKIKNLIHKIGEEYFVMCEHGNGVPLSCVKQSCIDIRTAALTLIGIIAATEQEHTEDVTRILKRQQQEK